MASTLQSAHTSQAPAQPSSFSTSTSTLAPSANLTTPIAQPPNPFNIQSKPAGQAFSVPLQSASACPMQPTMSQTQPLSQALNGSSHCTGLPVAPRGDNAGPVLRSEPPPATQPATKYYPHQVDSPGGPTATAPFLQDFNLVAEAAKRAQMSIVMRDLEGISL